MVFDIVNTSMLSQFVIFKPSGLVLFNYQPGKNFSAVIDSFIEDVVISKRKFVAAEGTTSEIKEGEEVKAEEKELLLLKEGGENDDNNVYGSYSYGNYSVKYLIRTEDKQRVFFTMVYPSLVMVKGPYEFLKNIRILWENTEDISKFEQFFKLRVLSIQESRIVSDSDGLEENNEDHKPKDGDKEKIGKKQKKGKGKGMKKSRKWNDDGTYRDYADEDNSNKKYLDYSQEKQSKSISANLDQLIGDKKNFGSRTSTGEFLVKDLSDEMNEILESNEADNKKAISSSTASSHAFGFLKNIIGGKKIQKEDIEKVKTALSRHLIKKNVAPNVANSLIAEIEKELVGSKTESFTSVEVTAKKCLEKQLIKLLTPNSSIDLLNEIERKRSKTDNPYVISVVGVNGVGKSTNLSKLAYWFLQNKYRVLITACDTFRSGAVEQLRTHVNNLSKLSPDHDQIELFEGGYGGSNLVAKIATGAIKYAKENGFDIVLLDTAGRRHNDAHLMTPLASFARAANPDKIIMVGEALVGTDSVMQAKNFDKAFGANRHLDFFIISKCDTVGDMIGSMVNMVFATGIPILFVGTGQTYTDLRTLSVEWAVNKLMS